MKTITPRLSQRETAIILAALRNYQFAPPRKNEWIDNIASDCGSIDPLSLSDIDKLCERINTERAK
jgi:hypothetical protein